MTLHRRVVRKLGAFGVAVAVALGIQCGTARADDADVVRADDPRVWPNLSDPSTIAADGQRDAALVIAIESYAQLLPVTGARLNGKDWTLFFTEHKKIPAEHVHTLRDAQATREKILAEATEAASEVRPGGTLFVIFIGHGAPGQDGSEGVLVTADTARSEESLYARGVAQHELAGAMARGPAAHRVLLADAFFSGRAAGGQPLIPGFHPLAFHPVPPPNLTLLNAADADEFAGPLQGVSRPAFSYFVLGALRGWGNPDGQGTVTARDAVGYARKMVSGLPIHRRQTPNLGGTDFDVPLASGGSERGPEAAEFTPPPPPLPPPPVTNREILPPTDRPPPDAIFVDFMENAKHWQVVNVDEHDRPVCSLPCSRWVPRAAKLAYVENRPGSSRRLLLDLSGVEPGTRIKFHFRSRLLAKVGLVLGGVAVTVGSGFLWVAYVHGPGGDPSGLIGLTIAGPVMVYGGFDLPMTYFARDRVARPHAFDPRKHALRIPPSGPRVRTS
jgi:hypothetical protein